MMDVAANVDTFDDTVNIHFSGRKGTLDCKLDLINHVYECVLIGIRDKTMTNKLMYNPMMVHKITPSID